VHGRGNPVRVARNGLLPVQFHLPHPEHVSRPNPIAGYKDGKRISIAGISDVLLLFFLLFGLNAIMNMIIPYDIATFGGMRQINDPIMLLFSG
jgi:hypothetical protein